MEGEPCVMEGEPCEMEGGLRVMGVPGVAMIREGDLLAGTRVWVGMHVHGSTWRSRNLCTFFAAPPCCRNLCTAFAATPCCCRLCRPAAGHAGGAAGGGCSPAAHLLVGQPCGSGVQLWGQGRRMAGRGGRGRWGGQVGACAHGVHGQCVCRYVYLCVRHCVYLRMHVCT